MNEIEMILLMLVTGFLLGGFFFGGLWWTTKRALLSKSPALWFLTSLFIRLGVTIAAFYFISHAHWERALICLAGFVIARMIIMKFTEVPEIKHNQEKGKVI